MKAAIATPYDTSFLLLAFLEALAISKLDYHVLLTLSISYIKVKRYLKTSNLLLIMQRNRICWQATWNMGIDNMLYNMLVYLYYVKDLPLCARRIRRKDKAYC